MRIARTGLPVPEYRTELPQIGAVVLAIGSPLGFQGTATAGIVSGAQPRDPGSAPRTRALMDLIQPDARSRPGNSGGALLDTHGQVIGINEVYIPPAAGAVSLGFAIDPVGYRGRCRRAASRRRHRHPPLPGVSLGRLTSVIKQRLGVQADAGALVIKVDPGGPAATAGLRPGDVITALGAQPVTSVEDVLGALRRIEPGQPVSITVPAAASSSSCR